MAAGAGANIALACDIIIASDQAKFALPEPRVGDASEIAALHGDINAMAGALSLPLWVRLVARLGLARSWALGMALADLIVGSYSYIIGTLLIKGGMALFIGTFGLPRWMLARSSRARSRAAFRETSG